MLYLSFVEQKCVRLPEKQAKWLEALAKELGVSEGEIVRRALDEYRERKAAREDRR
jgi:predicted DNA-binding protein